MPTMTKVNAIMDRINARKRGPCFFRGEAYYPIDPQSDSDEFISCGRLMLRHSVHNTTLDWVWSSVVEYGLVVGLTNRQ